MESDSFQSHVVAGTDGVMVEPEIVRQIRALSELGWGTRRIADEVVRDLLAERGIEVDVRVVQRLLAPHRHAKLAAEAATVRFETAPGH